VSARAYFAKSERDERPWAGVPAVPIFNPSGLPRNNHELAWESGVGRCRGCDLSTDDLGTAAQHLARSQWMAAPFEKLVWPSGHHPHPAGKTGPLNPTKETT
jgi:hypothetical protein